MMTGLPGVEPEHEREFDETFFFVGMNGLDRGSGQIAHQVPSIRFGAERLLQQSTSAQGTPSGNSTEHQEVHEAGADVHRI